VDDGGAGPCRGLEIDVVHADAGATDDDQPVRGRQGRGVELHLAAHEDRVVVGNGGQKGLAREARADVHLVLGTEEVQALRRERLGDEDPHTALPAGTWADVSAARRASTSAAPRSPGGSPRAMSASSMMARAASTSLTVTAPRCPRRRMWRASLPWRPARIRPRAFRAPWRADHSRPSGTYAAVTVSEACAGSAKSVKPS